MGGGWIDVHHHSYHPPLIAELRRRGVTHMAPGVPLPEWTVEDSLRVMDANGVRAAILSILLPDAALGQGASSLVRQANEWSAELVRDFPGRFGALAVLPLPDVEAALAEIEYALDVLGLDGVVMSASLADGRYLGDPAFAPVFDELDRRGAVVFVHPNPAYRCDCVGGPGFAAKVPPPLVDFVMDTTRAVADLLFGGTLTRCRDIRFVLAHAGGTVPYLAWRLELAATWVLPGAGEVDVAGELRRLYYETAQAASPATLACLAEVTGRENVLFGTDFPFMRDAVVAETLRHLAEAGQIPFEDNTLALFPRLADRLASAREGAADAARL
ncbi:amidohydrolase family protein [Streptosporangium saharense]|uniref:Putative TIM-barrel fold metal-dependent hydrolase n=1 Tax=Streptosporangium saharense TaxID=1706840 RepID=A0A7W7VQ86_9ACTN|nr:amidohydrolase family protein [Streptosporangium saharense]MBB4918284.1 putative TIM-barrel fold metal-dependent hydrolase [Streptosporangium saharense]